MSNGRFFNVRSIWSDSDKLLKYTVFPKNRTKVLFINLMTSDTMFLSKGVPLKNKSLRRLMRLSGTLISATVSTKSIKMDSENLEMSLSSKISGNGDAGADTATKLLSGCGASPSSAFLFLNPIIKLQMQYYIILYKYSHLPVNLVRWDSSNSTFSGLSPTSKHRFKRQILHLAPFPVGKKISILHMINLLCWAYLQRKGRKGCLFQRLFDKEKRLVKHFPLWIVLFFEKRPDSPRNKLRHSGINDAYLWEPLISKFDKIIGDLTLPYSI